MKFTYARVGILASAIIAATVAIAATQSPSVLKDIVVVGLGSSTTKTITFDNGSGGSDPVITATTANALKMTSPVGVGTATPGSNFSVNGSVSAGTYSGTAAPSNGLIISGKVGLGTLSPSNSLDVNGAISAGTYAGTSAPSNGLIVSGSSGIGTNSPASKLDVNGSISIGTYTGTAAPPNGLIVSGQVGIGTPTPSSTFEVNGSLNAYSSDIFFGHEGTAETGNPIVFIYGGTGSGGSGRSAAFQVDSTNRNLNIGGFSGVAIYSNVMNELAPTTGTLGIYQSSSGNVGINTSIPGYKLEVNGSTYIDQTGGNVPHGCRAVSNTGGPANQLNADCSAGEIATGGGCEFTTTATVVTGSCPESSFGSSLCANTGTLPVGWVCEGSSGSVVSAAYTVCCAY